MQQAENNGQRKRCSRCYLADEVGNIIGHGNDIAPGRITQQQIDRKQGKHQCAADFGNTKKNWVNVPA